MLQAHNLVSFDTFEARQTEAGYIVTVEIQYCMMSWVECMQFTSARGPEAGFDPCTRKARLSRPKGTKPVCKGFNPAKANRLRAEGGSLVASLVLSILGTQVAPVSAMPSVWDSPTCDEFSPNWDREFRFSNIQSHDLCVLQAWKKDGRFGPASKVQILEWIRTAMTKEETLSCGGGISWASEFDQNQGYEFLVKKGYLPLISRLEKAWDEWSFAQDCAPFGEDLSSEWALNCAEARREGCAMLRQELTLATKPKPHRKPVRTEFLGIAEKGEFSDQFETEGEREFAYFQDLLENRISKGE